MAELRRRVSMQTAIKCNPDRCRPPDNPESKVVRGKFQEAIVHRLIRMPVFGFFEKLEIIGAVGRAIGTGWRRGPVEKVPPSLK